MGSDLLEHALRLAPLLGSHYDRRAARLKRGICLALHRVGLLRPFTFVQWLATYGCNLRCPYCEASAGKRGVRELETHEVRGLVDDLGLIGVRRLVISGGEPLVREDLIELMEHAAQRRLRLGLVSNGVLVEEMWQDLRRMPYFLYFTSLDGLPDYHDRTRGEEGAFQKAMKGLALFQRLGVPTIMVNTVVHPGNLGQLEPLRTLLGGVGPVRWRLTPVSRIGRAAAQPQYDLGRQELRHLVRFILESRKTMDVELGESHGYVACFAGESVGKPFFCGAGLTRCSILPGGEVMGCHQVYDPALSEGNIRETRFPVIWKRGFSRFRNKGIRPFCRDCRYLDQCQGGCWAEMEKRGGCLRPVWEGKRSEEDAHP